MANTKIPVELSSTPGIVDNSNATAITIDSSENVGIGTSSPSTILEIASGNSGGDAALDSPTFRINNTTESADWDVGDAIGTIEYYTSDDSGNAPYVASFIKSVNETGNGTLPDGALTFGTATYNASGGAVERMRIDSSGNVGIGCTPHFTFDVQLNSSRRIGFNYTDSQNTILSHDGSGNIESLGLRGNELIFYSDYDVSNPDGVERMRIDSSGNVGITASASLRFNGTGDSTHAVGYDSTVDGSFIRGQNGIRFITATGSGTERMRIDSSGNLMVGNTDSTPYNRTSGNAIALGDGLISSAQDGGNAAIFNRMTSDGYIVEFRKDGGAVGRIATKGGLLAIGDSDCGIAFEDGTTNHWYPWNIAAEATSDNIINIGAGSARFDNIYATNGTIQTSDRNEKQNIEDLTEAETRVAVAAKGLLKKFKFKSAVEEKGDEARIHFGIIAQDLQDAFTAEGLDAGDYAMFCSDTWTDDDGVEQTRLGVRYSELLAFIIAAI